MLNKGQSKMVISLVNNEIRKLDTAIKYIEGNMDNHVYPNSTIELCKETVEKHTVKIEKLTKIKEALGWNPEN